MGVQSPQWTQEIAMEILINEVNKSRMCEESIFLVTITYMPVTWFQCFIWLMRINEVNSELSHFTQCFGCIITFDLPGSGKLEFYLQVMG